MDNLRETTLDVTILFCQMSHFAENMLPSFNTLMLANFFMWFTIQTSNRWIYNNYRSARSTWACSTKMWTYNFISVYSIFSSFFCYRGNLKTWHDVIIRHMTWSYCTPSCYNGPVFQYSRFFVSTCINFKLFFYPYIYKTLAWSKLFYILTIKLTDWSTYLDDTRICVFQDIKLKCTVTHPYV